jgi:serine/threonine protein kinase
MTYEMLLGKSPYQDDIIKIARQEMAPQLSELKFPNEADLSSEARDFITQTLHIDASQRIGIVEALKH